MSLLNIDKDILLYCICKHLEPKDVLNLSHTCVYTYETLIQYRLMYMEHVKKAQKMFFLQMVMPILADEYTRQREAIIIVGRKETSFVSRFYFARRVLLDIDAIKYTRLHTKFNHRSKRLTYISGCIQRYKEELNNFKC